jgi:hypothetical protein
MAGIRLRDRYHSPGMQSPSDLKHCRPMNLDSSKKHCSFCGEPGSADPPLVGGLGAFICGVCVDDFAAGLAVDRPASIEREPAWDSMTDTDILSKLWLIAGTAFQAEDFLLEWVHLARSRNVSWIEIGKALGISRWEAQERFAPASRA